MSELESQHQDQDANTGIAGADSEGPQTAALGWRSTDKVDRFLWDQTAGEATDGAKDKS